MYIHVQAYRWRLFMPVCAYSPFSSPRFQNIACTYGVNNILYDTVTATKEHELTRTISPSMANVLQALELERPTLVTATNLAMILEEENVRTPARVVASRLKKAGWLIPTEQRGVWEFAPAELAGAYSSGDPLIGLRSYLAKHPHAPCALTFQAAAWAHGFSDRVPARPEVAASATVSRALPTSLHVSVFLPILEYEGVKNVPVLAKESILAHMCEKPSSLRSWESAREWLAEMASELVPEKVIAELAPRPQSVKSRTGYLLKRLRPDIASEIYFTYKPMSKTWFGPRRKLLRHDNKWLIADTLLPFDPERLEAVND